MAERFNPEAYKEEHPSRLKQLASNANIDSVKPNEAIRRIMQQALQVGNPFIQEGATFIVMGHDGFSGDWFPTGSFQTVEEAFECTERKRAEEHLYSGGDEISTTFHTFTRDGYQVNHKPGEDNKQEPSIL